MCAFVFDYCFSGRPETAEHGLSTFVRLVRAILGPTSVSDSKVECGMTLVILGILVSAFRARRLQPLLHMLFCKVKSSKLKVEFNLCPKKRIKWIDCIKEALACGHLEAGSASKLAGKLNFATQHLFRRLGRAMIRPIYAQACSGTGIVNARLREALEWWLRVLVMDITEECPLGRSTEQNICKMFVDAASTPAHCAAVLCIDGELVYTDAEPDPSMVKQLAERRDKQITSLVKSYRCFAIMHRCALSVRTGDLVHLFGINHLRRSA